ncbi:MAG TPA: hypothetical protein G4N98_08075, partial [Thermoflexia bacterium]|nr:hypothetical protein [Thermoflexia bacterium]
GADVAYTVYDAASASWGADNTLTSDGLLEESLSPVFDGQGNLCMAYNKVTMDWITTTRVVEISPTLTVTVTEYMPEPVQSDLFQMVHILGRDLGIGDDDIVLSDPNPAPGDHVIISATVHNLGDLAATGAEVTFYDGDPGAGGTPIGASQSLISPFRAATVDTVSVVWEVPAGANSHSLYVVVDPVDAITETNEANNQAMLSVVLPDLTVAWAHSLHTTGALTLTAAISNGGTLAATGPFNVAFRARDPSSGTLLGTAVVGSDLAAGGRISVSVTISDLALLADAGNRFWAIADAGEVVIETNEANNTHYANLNALPDLTLTPADIQLGNSITVTIHNAGVLTATDAILSVRQDSSSGGLVYSGALGDLGPGISKTVDFNYAGDCNTFWVKADPDDTVAESDESNNLAVRVNCPQSLISVDIDGPTSGVTNTPYNFTAAIVPAGATEPIEYTWTPTPDSGAGQPVATYSWDSLGMHTITVTVENCGGSNVTMQTITISAPQYRIYLPVVLRNYEYVPPPVPDRYVKRYGSAEGDCSTPATACGSIQYAVDQANPGDLIGIAGYEDSIYTPDNPYGLTTPTYYWATESRSSPTGYDGPDNISQVVYIDKSITLYGGYNSDFDSWNPGVYKTVLRPGINGFEARVVFIAPHIAPTLEWLYIIEGDASGQGGSYAWGEPGYEDAGNGIFAWADNMDDPTSVTVRNCVIANNTGNVSSGGGVYVNNRNNTIIANNTVRGNRAYRGGGIAILDSDNVLVSDNEVLENIAYGQQAGGIYLFNTDGARLTGNHIYGNTANSSGGGIEARASRHFYLIGNTVHDNIGSLHQSGVGGGVDLFGISDGCTVQDNVIYNNIATVYTGQGDTDTGIGGGLYITSVDGGVVVGNSITGNVGSQYFRGTGGGLSIYASQDILVERNLIRGNVATPNGESGPLSTGGGVRISAGSTGVVLSNNIIVGNQAPAGGGGVVVTGISSALVESIFLHNTIADNETSSSGAQQVTLPEAGYEPLPGAASALPDGPQFDELRMLAESAVPFQHHFDAAALVGTQGILVDAYSTLNGVNNLLSGHTLGISVTYPTSSTVTMDYTLWHDNATDYSSGITHTHDRSGDPAFVNPAAGDYHIGPGSAAIDQGVNAGVTTDWDGDTRPQGGGYDIGADEYTGVLTSSMNQNFYSWRAR